MRPPQDIPVTHIRASATARQIKIGQVMVLAESIKQIGLRQPINVRPVQGGYEVRGGGHRLDAFRVLGRETIPAFVCDDDDIHAELAEIDENYCRADLSPAERALFMSRRKALYEALHPETRQHVAGGKARQDAASDKLSFAEDAAKKTGKNRRTVERDTHRGGELGEETIRAVIGTSLDKGDELDALAKLSPEKREEVIGRAHAGGKVSAKVEAKKERRGDKEAALAQKQIALPSKKFGLIYADIPRHFNVHSDETGMDRSPENHYPTMSFDETCRLPVASIAADDSILIFWSTAASLIDDIDIMAEWGFITLRPRTTRGELVRKADGALAEPEAGGGRYCSMQVWDKVRMGLGYWFRDRHEFILIGVRGDVVPPAPGTQAESLFSEPKGKHSAKPDRVAEMIERLWPNIPKIELFARRARPGWEVWGKEAPISVPEHEFDALSTGEITTTPSPASSPAPLTEDDGLEIPTFLDRRVKAEVVP